MTVPIPKIDDRTFDDLRKMLIAEIPLWSSPAVGLAVWDDHNVSDPGVAASELAAAMAEVLIYRCDQIDDATRVNFLQLVLDRPEPVTTNVRFVRPAPSVDVTGIVLPPFPPALAPRFTASPTRLELRGVMQAEELAVLLALRPADAAYAAAMQALFVASGRAVNVAAGTRLSGAGTTEIFETVQTVSIVPPDTFVDVIARHRSVDPRLPIPLGTSSGRANQVFQLPRRIVGGALCPVLLDSTRVDRNLYDPNPQITVTYGAGAAAVTERWTFVRDLLEAGPTDQVFTVDWLTYRVQFGDNSRGGIPVEGAAIAVVHMQGVEGRERQRDVAALDAIAQTWARSPVLPAAAALGPFPRTSVDTVRNRIIHRPPMNDAYRDGLLALLADPGYRAAILDLFETSNLLLRNPLDATGTGPLFGSGGRFLFDVGNALEEGLPEVRSRERAVTAADFEHLAEVEFNEQVVRTGPRIRRAHARRLNDAGTVAVVVIPDAAADEPSPLPSDELLRRLQDFLDPRRLITTRVLLGPPTYVPVPIRIGVAPQPRVSGVGLAAEIVARVRRFLHPLFGGDDGRGAALGRPVYRSDLYRLLHDLPAVQYVWRLQLGTQPDADQFVLGALELPAVQITEADVVVGSPR